SASCTSGAREPNERNRIFVDCRPSDTSKEFEVKTVEGSIVTARVVAAESRPAIELSVPRGTSLETIFKARNAESLAKMIAGLGARGCQTCISGQDFIIRERFEEVIQVELEVER